MKRTAKCCRKNMIHFRRKYRYPNAAERRYYLDRISDWFLAAATACGTITIVIFLIFII